MGTTQGGTFTPAVDMNAPSGNFVGIVLSTMEEIKTVTKHGHPTKAFFKVCAESLDAEVPGFNEEYCVADMLNTSYSTKC